MVVSIIKEPTMKLRRVSKRSFKKHQRQGTDHVDIRKSSEEITSLEPQMEKCPDQLTPVERTVRRLLRTLRATIDADVASKTTGQLLKALYDDEDFTYEPQRGVPNMNEDEISRPVAEAIVGFDGCGAFLAAIEKFLGCKNTYFVYKALHALVVVSTTVPEASRQIVEQDGVRTLLKLQFHEIKAVVPTATPPRCVLHYMEECLEYCLLSDLVCLLQNLTSNVDGNKSKGTIATEECMNLTIKVLEKYPHDEFVQTQGIRNMVNLGALKDQRVHSMLEERTSSAFVCRCH